MTGSTVSDGRGDTQATGDAEAAIAEAQAQGKQVFTGTVEAKTGQQLADEEGQSLQQLFGDYASSEAAVQYVILRLDSPQDVTATNADGEIVSRTVNSIALANYDASREGSPYLQAEEGDFSGWQALAGRRVTVAIGSGLWWPSDASLPMDGGSRHYTGSASEDVIYQY